MSCILAVCVFTRISYCHRYVEYHHHFQSLETRQKLPIAIKASEIVSMIQQHPVVIIRGNTGCGKTTQVPQFILDSMIASGKGTQCNIVVTQVTINLSTCISLL